MQGLIAGVIALNESVGAVLCRRSLDQAGAIVTR
jgi:hypothetical protein